MRSSRNPKEYFESSFIVDKITGCWNWSKGKNKRGYGQFWLNDLKRMVNAHRFSYELNNAKIKDSLIVCHTCDNPDCVNPKHLFLGTHTDNIQDMLQKDRRVKTARTFRTKKQIKEIIELKRAGISTKIISETYHISYGGLCNMFSRKKLTKKHLTS